MVSLSNLINRFNSKVVITCVTVSLIPYVFLSYSNIRVRDFNRVLEIIEVDCTNRYGSAVTAGRMPYMAW